MPLRLLASRREPVVLDDRCGEDNVVLFDPRLERSVEPLINRLRGQALSLSSLGLLVLRTSHRDAVAAIEADEVLADYLADVPVVVLAGGHDATAPGPKVARPRWAPVSGITLDLDEIRAAELDAMLRRSNAVFRREGCHFALPSAAVHAESFIRLADAMQDPLDLVRLADWLLGLLGEGSGLAADTGSLLGLMATTRAEALRRFGWDVPIANLDHYPPSDGVVQAFIDNFAAAGWERLTFLISVNSTGGVARRVLAREPDARLVALCETATAAADRADAAGPAGATVLAEWPVERWPVDADGRCERCPDVVTLDIHPETYEVVAGLTWRAIGFDQERIDAEREFWAIADETDAVALHVNHATSRGARQEVRHLGVNLDVERLLSHPAFAERCRHVLDERFPAPAVVLVPEHPAAPALAALAESVWAEVPVMEVALGELTGEARAAVAAAEDVLVMDDVVITAQTLFGLRASVYAVSREVDHKIRLWGFVPLARTETEAAWARIRSRYMDAAGGALKHALFAAQNILLPPPGAVPHCPWCRERDHLLRRVSTLPEPTRSRAAERAARLRGGPLLPPLGIGGVGPEERTQGAIVGDLRPAAAFAAGVALAQHLKEDLSRRRTAADIYYFNVELLLTVIFDATMFGGFLRTFDPRDVRDPSRTPDLAACLLGKTWEPGMLAEVAIGAAEHKLPRRSVVDCIAGQADPGDGTLELLAALASGA